MNGADERRYLVYRYGGHGLGHDLTAILNFARAAATTGRIFALDLSNFKYTTGDRHRGFFENYRLVLPPTLEVLTDLDRVRALYSEPDRYESPPYEGNPVADRPERVVIFTSNADQNIQSVANKFEFWPCYAEPIGPLAEAMRGKLIEPDADSVTIGLYFRSGNGEFLDLRFDPVSLPDYDARYPETIARYVDIARILAMRHAGKRVTYYVASDSTRFVAAMREHLGEVVTLPDAGFDMPFGNYVGSFAGDIKPFADAMADITNLSRCDFLVYSPSLFPVFAVTNSQTLDARTSYALPLSSVAKVIAPMPPAEKYAYLERSYRAMPYFSFYPRQAVRRYHGLVLQHDGEPERGAAMVRRADLLMQCNRTPGIEHARAIYGHGDMARADAMLAAAPEAGNPYVREFRAMIRAFMADHEGACQLLREAINDHPDVAEPYVTLIRLLLTRGALREAAGVAARGLAQCGPDAALLAQRATILGSMRGEGGLMNVAGGKHCTTSGPSPWSFDGEADCATNGVFTREFNFHTDRDQPGWWSIDLAANEAIRRVVVYNRDDARYQHAADGLQLLVSDDGAAWREVVAAAERFTGVSGGRPWDVWFDDLVRARYVKLQVPQPAFLHLQQVEIYAER